VPRPPLNLRLLTVSVVLASALGGAANAQNTPAQPALAQTVPLQLSPMMPTAPIYVAYPKDGAKVAADHVIFEGSVLPGAGLSVGGRPLQVGADGLFIEWLPLKPGLNVLTLTSTLNGQTSTLKYNVTSSAAGSPPGAASRLPATPARILPGTLTPDGPWTRYGAGTLTLADRRLDVSFGGSPGGRAIFWVGERGPFSMAETSAGRYGGGYTLRDADTFAAAQVRFLLIAPGGGRAEATAPGSVSSLPGPRFAEITAPDQGRGVNTYQSGWAVVGGPNLLYPRQGTRFRVVGETAGTFLTRLPGQPATGVPELPLLEVTRSTATLLPAGASLPPARLTTPTVQDTGSHLALRLPLGARVPYLLTQTPGGLRLSLYGTQGDPADLNAAPLSDPLLSGLTWSRADSTGTGPLTADLTLTTAQQWGYDAVYDGTTLVLQVRRPPTAPVDPASPLAGRTLVIDPGHGGSETGGAGALRINEKDLVLATALEVAARLRAAGATVVMTRTGDVQVPLYTRDLMAETANADLLVSIHANALPDGTDPRGVRGSGVYFSHPQATVLAQDILGAITSSPALVALGQPGNDGLHGNADLALTRPSTQISLLVETAYLTDPGNLRTLMSAEGRSAYAQAIAEGILKFYADSAQARPAEGLPTTTPP